MHEDILHESKKINKIKKKNIKKILVNKKKVTDRGLWVIVIVKWKDN